MIYREAGQFKTSYQDDQAIFPIRQDKIGVFIIVGLGATVLPALASEYLFQAILIPFLILSLGVIGLNILLGYCGQVSLGSGAFMAVGAYAAWNFATRVPEMNLLLVLLCSGLSAAAFGVLFGLPSLRIKGFYLAVATLAAQFFVEWMFNRVGWFTNYAPSGSITAPSLSLFGITIQTAREKYYFLLILLVVFTLLAKNIIRGWMGRSWMAIRDMDLAAEIIGIRPLWAKLSAFAVSSFFIGVAGALWAFVYLGSWEPAAFDLNRSFQLLFMVIIGGLGSLVGCFFGTAFMLILPILLNQVPAMLGLPLSTATISHLEFIIFGSLIIFFLIVEPHGLARLWQIGKEKLRLWPFPH